MNILKRINWMLIIVWFFILIGCLAFWFALYLLARLILGY